MNHHLENYYSGDWAWNQFVSMQPLCHHTACACFRQSKHCQLYRSSKSPTKIKGMSYENGIAPITQKLKTQVYVLDFTYYSRPFRGRFYFLPWQRKRNTRYHDVPMVRRFFGLHFCEHVPTDEGFPTPSLRHRLCRMDRYRGGRYRLSGNFSLQGTHFLLAPLLPHYPYRLGRRTQSSI